MESFGINLGYLLDQLFNFLLVGGWLLAVVYTLLHLRRQELDDTARAIWVAIILLIPVIGALAYLIVQPGRRAPSA
jgi:hypothetical protein